MDYTIVDGRVRTRALEYHVTDHCNLRCDHCCSYSPILKKWLVDPLVFERDLVAIKKVVAPEFVKIVGGEPLLHPELEQLLTTAKRLDVGPRVQLTTNGILIDRLTENGWRSIDMLAISLYPEPPIPKATLRAIAKEAASRCIEVSWKVQDKFTCLDRSSLASREEARDTFNDCWIRHRCNSIKDGRFYCCTRPQYIQKFAADPSLYQEDGVLVHVEDTAALALRLQAHLRQTEPLQSCFLCNGGNAPLDTHRQLSPSEVAAKRLGLTEITIQAAAAR